MLEQGKTYRFTSRSGESKDFKITLLDYGFHNWHGKTRWVSTEYSDPSIGGRMRAADVRNRQGEWYVRVPDQNRPKRFTTYWLPMEHSEQFWKTDK